MISVGVVRADCSFSGDTMVTTTTGYQAIATISIGDYVLAYHEVEGTLGYYPVLAEWAHEDTVIIELVIDGEVIFTTPDHPFYTEQGDWLPAAALQVGDEIRQADWDSGTVETITFIASPQTMYNFTVATAHTYFVGVGQWLVHNACPLRNNIGAQPGVQAHHLIPNQLQNHPFVQQATKGGWNQNAAYNGMALPDNSAAAVNVPYHRGSHANYTNNTVLPRLNNLQGQNLTPAQAFQELQNLAGQLRTHINNLPPGTRID